VFLWLDEWHPPGYLLDRYGYWIEYDSSLPLNAKLAAIIKDGDWFWTSARSDALVEIQSQLHEVNLGSLTCLYGIPEMASTLVLLHGGSCEKSIRLLTGGDWFGFPRLFLDTPSCFG
jgi:hypothetical protein